MSFLDLSLFEILDIVLENETLKAGLGMAAWYNGPHPDWAGTGIFGLTCNLLPGISSGSPAGGMHTLAHALARACMHHGVRFLRDEAVLVDGAFHLAGREDRSVRRFNGHRRKDLGRILDGLDRRYPVILMDHQPLGLHEAVQNGVALQVSGHTHNGQLWPVNWITRRIFEISYGYGKIGDTHVYVSNGYGTWGPPVRTVNRPEIVHLRIHLVPDAGKGEMAISSEK